MLRGAGRLSNTSHCFIFRGKETWHEKSEVFRHGLIEQAALAGIKMNKRQVELFHKTAREA